jgi:hypothetical protein
MLKGKEYMNNLHSLEEIKENIKHEISHVSVQQLQRMSRNMFSWCEAYREAESNHLRTLL